MFVPVCAEADLVPGGMRRFDVSGRPVALYRVGAACFATAAICTHEHADLTEGEFDGRAVACPLHGARFEVATGGVLSPPAFRRLATYPTRVREGQVEVDLP
jgi:nitrite reductase/ring-hydroxylating ferredoxin subunit